MFTVQVVRRGAQGLQALRRCMTLGVGERGLKVFAGSDEGRCSPVIQIARARIQSVRIRARLLRVVGDGAALTVRLRDEEEALQAAQVMMEMWDIDPLVEGSGVIEAATEDGLDCMTELAERYMTCPRFRQLIHEIHGHIDAIMNGSQLDYEPPV